MERNKMETTHTVYNTCFGYFDIFFNPVSNVYVEDLENIYKEAARVLKKGGLLMVGFMNPWIYMYDADIA